MAEEVRTLWIGNLQNWVDESYLNYCFAHTGEVISVKIIRNKISGQPAGYGFVEFASRAAAERILQTYNGIQMPGTEITFKLNWASYGTGERRPDAASEHPIFLWNLAYDVTDYLLQETFRVRYPSVMGAKVMTDPNTGHSMGYGFVNFANENERNRAMAEMDGVYCLTRPMRIGEAMPRKAIGVHQQSSRAMYPVSSYSTPTPALPADYDANNTTVFVGNLDSNITAEELKQNFSWFGEIVSVKILAGKGYGFVQFGARPSAEEAIHTMQGKIIGRQLVFTSWSKNSAAKQGMATWGQQVGPNQWNANYGHGGAYGYGAVQDPSLYAYGAYSGYASYPQQPFSIGGYGVDGVQDLAAVAGAAPVVEQGDEWNDTLDTPDVDYLNDAYLSKHESAILGRPLWLTTSSLARQT